MSHLPATVDEVQAVIQNLHVAVPKYQLTDATLAATVRAYREALMPYDAEAIRGGAKLVLRTAEKFPTPATLRTAIQQWIRHNRTRLEDEHESPRDAEGRLIVCRTCRSTAHLAILTRPDGTDYTRFLAPCHPDRHGASDLLVPFPPNFAAWAAEDT